MIYKIEKVGKVDLFIPKKLPSDVYVDGDVEDELLELFRNSKNTDKARREILSNNPSWPMYCILTPKRGNLVRWYEFKKDSKVLEVGAGHGAITEELVKKDIEVTALELTLKRAQINAERNKTATNLSVIVDNLQNYKSDKKFDYIVCVGVLEYAGTFIHSSSPYHDFMRLINMLLVPGGKFLLAIENRLGLKYWAGAKEDHVDRYFEGQNNYPSPARVQTFGRKELQILFKNTGFSKTSFFYPFPDYKTPSFIYSDEYYPGKNANFPLGNLPTPTLDRERNHFMSEQSLMTIIEENDLFPEFSNSFLVEGIKS